MVRSEKKKELFTASEVARFCQVDLKTIHNWADRGEFQHFRTPGRHLRFRRVDVLDFLRRYGYPVPDVLVAGRPRIMVVGGDEAQARRVSESLVGDYEVQRVEGPLDALVTAGAEPPDAWILFVPLVGVAADALVSALGRQPATRHVRTVVVTADDAERARLLEAGASAVLSAGTADDARGTLDALLGIGR